MDRPHPLLPIRVHRVSGHVPDKPGKVWVFAGFSQYGGILGGHLATALVFQRARDDLRAAGRLLLCDQAVEVRHGVIWQPDRDLSAHG